MQDIINPEINSRTTTQVLRYIPDEINSAGIPQPMIIVGSAGAGKSTILRELESLMTSANEQKVMFFDGKHFFNSDDIIIAIEKACKEINSKRPIVLIDDLDYFFNRASYDDQYVLRNYLNRENAPLLIGTASAIDTSLTDYRAPFFEGFRIIYIPAVIPTYEYILKRDISDDKFMLRLYDLLKYLPPVVRSIKIASEIIALSENEQNDIKELINKISPLYRSKLESLPLYSQKILNSLAQSAVPETLSNLKNLTDMQSGTLSTYLRQLVSAGYIQKTDPSKRGAPYEICDPLFKLWLSGNY
ncbi:MAG: ArsR family transcriptional regulator [Barnesiella sp.]|nr:ArsR family transcriptional regulator [Barnesiella sp.]